MGRESPPNKSLQLLCTIMNTSDYLEIYKIYIDRIRQEGDWIWSRFKLYVTLNTAAFGAIGLVFREVKFDASISDIAKIITIFGISFVGRQIALEWTNVIKQGIFWENVFTWHAAQIEKQINKESVDLWQYLESYEQTTGMVKKAGMEYITEPMNTERKDPLFSSLDVSKTFKIMFEVIFVVSIVSVIVLGVVRYCIM